MTPQTKKNRIDYKENATQRYHKFTVVATRDFALSNEYTPSPIRAVWSAIAQEFSEEDNQRRKQEKTR